MAEAISAKLHLISLISLGQAQPLGASIAVLSAKARLRLASAEECLVSQCGH